MSEHQRDESIPSAMLLGLAGLVVVALLGAGAVRLSGTEPVGLPDPEPVVERALRFHDREDGAVVVVDAERDAVVHVVDPGTNGFVRGVLRGLARERKRRGIDASEPFRLIAGEGGRLTLVDPTTARQVDLEAFGPTNAAAFVLMLDTRTDEPAAARVVAAGSPGA